MTHSAGGEERSHFRMAEMFWREPIVFEEWIWRKNGTLGKWLYEKASVLYS
jgi:hypothetical protein